MTALIAILWAIVSIAASLFWGKFVEVGDIGIKQ